MPFGVVELAPLRGDEAADLAAQFGTLPGEVVAACVARAEGNPLFLEQLLRAAAAGEAALPDSVQSLVHARLDQLAPADRRAAQAAAVIGQRFTLGTVRHLLGRPEAGAEALLDAGLVRPDGDGLRFAHALVHEAVYASLLDGERLALHRGAAAWFAGRDAGLHAEQLDRAGDPAAAAAYRAAAAHEAGHGRFDRAIALADRALALTGEPALRHALACDRADWLLELGRPAEALAGFVAARATAEDDGERCRAALGAAAALRVLERHGEGLVALDEAEAAAQRAGLRAPRSGIHYLRGCMHFPLGNLEACLGAHQAALAAARADGSPFDEARALSGLGDAHYLRGDMAAALRDFERCLALAREHGFGRIEAANLHMRGVALLYLTDAEAALQAAEEAVERARMLGQRRAEVVARSCVCDIAIWTGDWSGLARAAAPIEPLARELGSPSFAVQGLSCRGYSLARAGQREAGLALLGAARRELRGPVVSFLGPTVLGMAAALSDDASDRQALLEEAEAQLAAGSVSHNHLAFRPLAMEACLTAHDLDGVERHCAALAEFGVGTALPWTRYFTAWGRALAATARGAGDGATLAALRDEATGGGLGYAVPLLEAALRRAA